MDPNAPATTDKQSDPAEAPVAITQTPQATADGAAPVVEEPIAADATVATPAAEAAPTSVEPTATAAAEPVAVEDVSAAVEEPTAVETVVVEAVAADEAVVVVAEPVVESVSVVETVETATPVAVAEPVAEAVVADEPAAAVAVSTEAVPEATPVVEASASEQSTPPAAVAATEPIVVSQTSAEIKEESLKSSLKEIISDMDRVIEREEEQQQQVDSSLATLLRRSSAHTSETLTTTSTTTTTSSQLLQHRASLVDANNNNLPVEFPHQEPIYTPPSVATAAPQKPDLQKILRPVEVSEEQLLPQKNHPAGEEQPVSDENKAPAQNGTQSHQLPSLKLIMDPRGKVQDMNSLNNNHGFGTANGQGMLSPDKCAELISALNTDSPKGKGAELFAKRQKRSEKWVVEGPTQQPQQQFEVAHPVPVNQQQHQAAPAYNPYVQPSVVPAPYIEPYQAPAPLNQYNNAPAFESSYKLPQAQPPQPNPVSDYSNSRRDLAYKPSIPQGWNAPAPVLPKDLYVPPEISLQNYAAPPVVLPAPVPQQPAYKPQPVYRPAPQPQQHFQHATPPQQQQQFQQAPPQQFGGNSPSSFYRPQPPPQQQQFNQQPAAEPLFVAPIPYIPKQAPSPFRPASGASGLFNGHQPNGHSPAPLRQQPVQYQQQQHLAKPAQQPFYPAPTPAYSPAQRSPNAIPTPPPANRSAIDINQLENYNRAARGWGQTKDYYRPITFSKPKVAVPYTDF